MIFHLRVEQMLFTAAIAFLVSFAEIMLLSRRIRRQGLMTGLAIAARQIRDFRRWAFETGKAGSNEADILRLAEMVVASELYVRAETKQARELVLRESPPELAKFAQHLCEEEEARSKK